MALKPATRRRLRALDRRTARALYLRRLDRAVRIRRDWTGEASGASGNLNHLGQQLIGRIIAETFVACRDLGVGAQALEILRGTPGAHSNEGGR